MADARERLIRCFSAIFPDLPEDQIPAASPAAVQAWDSVAAITLVSVIEEEFGVRVDPGDLEQLSSFGRILDWLRDRKGIR
jgi:acyl carrier protein